MNILKRVKYRRIDTTYIGHRRRPGWHGSLPFYRFNCKIHGPVENYPQGHAQILRCPRCDEEHNLKKRKHR